MGRRSRKRAPESGAGTSESSPGGTSRAERDAARQRRTRMEASGPDPRTRRPVRGRRSARARPPAPWGSFPLTETVGALAAILVVVSFFAGPARGVTTLLAGLALGSLVGLELSLREHLGGYRSHSLLLACGATVVGMTAALYAANAAALPRALGLSVALLAGLAAFLATFLYLRRVFRRRSGGLSFRM